VTFIIRKFEIRNAQNCLSPVYTPEIW